MAFCRGPCFGFPTPTVQRSTEPLLRGKAPASPLTAAPAEMRQEVRPCVSFLAMPLAGRNRRVSTMGVYHRRPIRRAEGATRRSSEPPRFNEAKCRAHRTRRALASWRCPDPPRRFSCLSPAVLTARCHATPSPPSPPKLPRSPVELPRSSDELPRWVFKLPRSGLKVPRSVSVLPRFAAMLGFAFPCAMGVFIPLVPVGFC